MHVTRKGEDWEARSKVVEIIGPNNDGGENRTGELNCYAKNGKGSSVIDCILDS